MVNFDFLSEKDIIKTFFEVFQKNKKFQDFSAKILTSLNLTKTPPYKQWFTEVCFFKKE